VYLTTSKDYFIVWFIKDMWWMLKNAKLRYGWYRNNSEYTKYYNTVRVNNIDNSNSEAKILWPK
jgi:hypothetical protein